MIGKHIENVLNKVKFLLRTHKTDQKLSFFKNRKLLVEFKQLVFIN